MSRSTVAKSRQEKTNKAASAPTPAVTHEIVPGKFNDQDWNSMLDHDDGDEFIYGIVEEVCTSAMDKIFSNYIEHQLVPYTVMQAKDAILQIIEWQFLARDEGEGDVEADQGWAQDEEPEPAVTDCWAQGSVPRTMLPPPTPEVIPEEDEEEETSADMEQQDEQAQIDADVDLPPVLDTEPTVIVEEKTTMAIEETIIEHRQQSSQDSTPKTGKRRKRGYKPHTGPMKSAGTSRLTESLEKTEMQLYMDEYNSHVAAVHAQSPDLMMMQMPSSCHSILKLQAGRPPGNRDVIYDEHGNVVSVNKLDPEKLPTHSVKTKFRVVDPSEESKQSGSNGGVNLRFSVVDPATEASRSRLEAMRTGKKVPKGGVSSSLVPRPPDSPRSSKSNTSRTSREPLHNYSNTREGVTPLPPPLIESMEVSPGVIVREGDRVKKGPRQRPKQSDLIAAATQRGLRAIHITARDPTLTVAEILQHQQPVVKPLESSPIPPIAHRSPVC